MLSIEDSDTDFVVDLPELEIDEYIIPHINIMDDYELTDFFDSGLDLFWCSCRIMAITPVL